MVPRLLHRLSCIFFSHLNDFPKKIFGEEDKNCAEKGVGVGRNLPFCPKAGRKKFFEWLGPGTNTKHKFKGEASSQSVLLNLVYTHTHPTPQHNF